MIPRCEHKIRLGFGQITAILVELNVGKLLQIMRQLMKLSTSLILIILPVVAVLLQPAGAYTITPSDFEDLAFFRPKQTAVVSAEAISYLEKHRSNGRVLVWVFLTDKGILTRRQMADRVSVEGVPFSNRAHARRAKHGVAEIRFSDMPVKSEYVEMIVDLGAKLRWTSKWLNAASFEIEPAQIDSLAKLPCVACIEPVTVCEKPKERMTPDYSGTAPQLRDGKGLSYGSSFGQLNQIAVPICHDSGYAGQGVIISMFDSGFRTGHDAFAQILAQGRLLATYDFVFNDGVVDNEVNDDMYAWDHGTATWSACSGENSGMHYGPAYQASFILCKTEDVRSETPVEEDNWVRAMEWVDSLGADIISSSLSYSAWYNQSQFNGSTCVTTLAADTAAAHGILVCNSAGNNGSAPTSISAPADAFGILAAGAVTSAGGIASFSSRGPTADGRIKPEVCAQGVFTHAARSFSNNTYSYWHGTSLSCPLIAGAAAIVWGAHPNWTNEQVREALIMTANRHATPDNDYGWGIINTWAAIHYSIFVAGDADGDGTIAISDAVYLIEYIFSGGAAPNPIQSGDADCNNDINVADAVRLVDYIFGNGSAPCHP